MTERLKHPKKPLNTTEAKKDDYQKWDDPVKKYQVRRRAKFNYDFVQIAARLVAAGFSETDLAYSLDVKPRTIKSWKDRYPQFKKACGNGKAIAKSYLVSKGLRAACGYDYDEETWVDRVTGVDDEGIEIREMVCTKRVHKYQKPDAGLLTFFLINMCPEEYSNTKTINVNETKKSLNLELTGTIESDQIKDFAGKLLMAADKLDKTKQVDSKVIDVT